MDRRELERRRRIRKRQRIRQRNRRIALFIGLLCFILCIGVVNIRKNKAEKEAQEAYAKQQEVKAKKEEEKEQEDSEKITMAEESEKSQWYLQLVNPKNPMLEDEVPEVELKAVNGSGIMVDARIYDDLQDMMKAAREAGRSPVVCSGFRKWDYQSNLYKKKTKEVMNENGLDEEAAAVKAATIVAIPGTSEHQVGFAVDIVAAEYQKLNKKQMETEDQKWLMENSWKYGFILRYPLDKSEVTGVMFEPWHYRYVGKKAAKEITEQHITLEEYLGAEPVGYPEV